MDKIKEKYKINNVVFIADAGLFNERNIRYLKKNNYHYVVGAMIKKYKEIYER